jgi:hypothetical protein
MEIGLRSYCTLSPEVFEEISHELPNCSDLNLGLLHYLIEEPPEMAGRRGSKPIRPSCDIMPHHVRSRFDRHLTKVKVFGLRSIMPEYAEILSCKTTPIYF